MMIRAKPEVKYKLIQEMTSRDNNLLNITWLCEIAGVSRSGYYRWLSAEPVRFAQELADREAFEQILDAYNHRGYAKGVRGIHMTLLHHSPPILMNLKKIRRLMRKYRLECPIRKVNPYKKMLREMHSDRVEDNIVNREFTEHGPRKILLTDITYIRRGSGGFTYLSTIIDAFTMEVLAFKLSDSLKVDFVLATVESLIHDHGIALTAETLVHSDQGTHYTSYAFSNILKDLNLRQSMSRKANCWDNAPQESFFGHMKDEITITGSMTHDDICNVVEQWIHYYNHERYQWDLAKLSPREFYLYYTTGVYPLKHIVPEPPAFAALIAGEQHGRPKKSSDDHLDKQSETDTSLGALPPSPPEFIALISRRAGALRREQQEKRRTNAPPSRKPDAPLGSLSSVALSCCISKATTLYNPFDGNVNSVTLLRHRLSTLRGAVQRLAALC